MTTTPLLTIGELASALGISCDSVRKDMARRGLVATIPGGRGRGKAALFDLAYVRAWRAAQDAAPPPTPLQRATRRAERIPDILAECAWATYMLAGPDKNVVAGHLAAMVFLALAYIDDELREVLPDLSAAPEPEKIGQLKSIGARFTRSRLASRSAVTAQSEELTNGTL